MYPQKYFFEIKTGKAAFQSRLEQLLVIKASNTFKTHLSWQDYLGGEFLAGESGENQFVFWKSNQLWSGLFYPVVKGQYFEMRGLDLLEIRVQFNPAAQTVVLCLSIVFIFAITSGIVIQQNNEWEVVILRGVIGIFLFVVLQSGLLISFITGRNRLLKELVEGFELSQIELRE